MHDDVGGRVALIMSLSANESNMGHGISGRV